MRKSEYKYDNDRAPNVRLSNVKVNIVQHFTRDMIDGRCGHNHHACVVVVSAKAKTGSESVRTGGVVPNRPAVANITIYSRPARGQLDLRQ